MAITGAAAIAGIAAGTVGAVSTTTIMVAGLALTAVGYITNSSLLKKIGGGLSLGGGVSGAAAGAAGAAGAGADAAGAADAAQSGMDAASVADSAGAGSQAAGDVAASATASATSTPADLISGYGGTADAASSGADAASAAGSVAPGAAVDSGMNVDAAGQGLVDQSINANLASQSPAMQGVGQSSGAATTSANPANAFTPNSNPANSIAANTNAQSAVTPGSQAAGNQAAYGDYGGTESGSSASGGPTVANGQTADVGGGNVATTADPTGSGYSSPQGFGSAVGPDGTAQAANMAPASGANIMDPSDYWNQAMSKFQSTWGDMMNKYGNSTWARTGAGLAQGLGQGALSMLSASKQQQLAAQEQAWQHANMTGAAMPTVGFSPSTQNPFATQPYTGATPKAASTGLINSAKG